jgi:hypothetical protein
MSSPLGLLTDTPNYNNKNRYNSIFNNNMFYYRPLSANKTNGKSSNTNTSNNFVAPS